MYCILWPDIAPETGALIGTEAMAEQRSIFASDFTSFLTLKEH